MSATPPLGLLELERIGEVGRAKGYDAGPVPRWTTQSEEFHLERARRHLRMLDLGDTSEDHLAHAGWRIAAALHQRAASRSDSPTDPVPTDR